MRPLASINNEVSNEAIKSCFDLIVPDYDEDIFHYEYMTAVELLKDKNLENTLGIESHCTRSPALKTALARVAAAFGRCREADK